MLSFLLYNLVIIPISVLPYRLLYILSDFLYLIFRFVIPYRKEVVLQNLRNSFPEKTESELKKICKVFYRHFCDLMMESLKAFTASDATISKRMIVKNEALLQKYHEQKKSVILVTGHYGNWEYAALSFHNHSKHQASGIYQPLSNSFFDKKMQQTRSKFGIKLIAVKEVNDFFKRHKNDLITVGFIADQSPSNPNRGHWVKFLNQDTCVLKGTENYARLYNLPVVFGFITKLRRGHYQIEYKLICDDPSKTTDGEITTLHTQMNEKMILQNPAYWLWTHRRWKHKRTITNN